MDILRFLQVWGVGLALRQTAASNLLLPLSSSILLLGTAPSIHHTLLRTILANPYYQNTRTFKTSSLLNRHRQNSPRSAG
jgi:hypothetical protein